MDENAELILAKAAQPPQWEDEEKATNDVEELREEFRRRLYANGKAGAPAGPRNGSAGGEAR